ncbi:ImmA/IrrE family metallo-endopeptidase [Brevibacillus laterosporus]|uniref:ImmA/IrrE family metallo-endopeptidase n=2 Tax=Brevibacillus laterosporus TaxID=1465 RepID=A0AAP3DLF0_BRELA|nr:ImmA/IrrE family metallo-endopeptidase [Brevibacillus laterosporus]AYB38568.1 ImmA/IrrE family metallo-endopeptidase [Brevibacillus laterosporus]MBM7110753.1 hypothetical protein [Brevibacillus laterosporus]MCR8982616.1 ImmA/IrrE family metallo-endopeptidase [Brevibacillus laterosporus]MCZ0809772.1 ImmA/IrrE family metallo-endopeptidase [Brevibacillus laterosporus]MCZ0828394.1 ImmA/IrrE family metallo-endopeptidase [Brevibacillus laterosporus]
MDFSLYEETPLEEWITQKYLQHSIFIPQELDIEEIVSIFGGEIAYLDTISHARWLDDGTNDFLIVLDSRLDKFTMRGEFFHELCHPLRHSGNQRKLPPSLRNLQEEQANAFQLYATIPFYMVKNMNIPLYKKQTIDLLAQEFKVTHSFAKKRLEQIEQRINQGKFNQAWNKWFQDRGSKLESQPYSHETIKLLEQLRNQTFKGEITHI